MTRKEVKVSVKMRPGGAIYACPSITGDIIVYEDQLLPINSKIGRCKTREEAKEMIHDFSCGLDLHHSDVQTPTIRKKSSRMTRTLPSARKSIQPSYTPPISRTTQTPITRKKGPIQKSTPTDTQVRITQSNDDTVHELE